MAAVAEKPGDEPEVELLVVPSHDFLGGSVGVGSGEEPGVELLGGESKDVGEFGGRGGGVNRCGAFIGGGGCCSVFSIGLEDDAGCSGVGGGGGLLGGVEVHCGRLVFVVGGVGVGETRFLGRLTVLGREREG